MDWTHDGHGEGRGYSGNKVHEKTTRIKIKATRDETLMLV